MEKVIIIGCPGSGKSTFGRKLSHITGLPLYHLDNMFWNEDKTIVSKDIFLERLMQTMSKSEWIIDGNYGSSMEMRIFECDTISFWIILLKFACKVLNQEKDSLVQIYLGLRMTLQIKNSLIL